MQKVAGRIRHENDVVVLSVTQKCNNFCVMCYEPHIMKDNPPLSELKKHVKELQNPSEIYISGGEPTLREDIFEIIDSIKENHPGTKINLITNGRRLSYLPFAKKLAKCRLNKVVTEIFGPSAEVHEAVTQSKGSFEQTMKGVENCLALGVELEIRIVITKINSPYLEETAKFCIGKFKGKPRIILFPINIIGFAYKNKEKVAESFTNMKKHIENALDIFSERFYVKLFHCPFCTVDKKYWKFIEKGITADPARLGYTSRCGKCSKKETCPRIWKSYLANFGENEFSPVKGI
jgi:His-Xaa-Ser system radical SAM maturase HxsC